MAKIIAKNDDERMPCFAGLVRYEHKETEEKPMEMTRNHKIVERIITERERYALSNAALAALTDGTVSASRLVNYETGMRRPGLEEAEALARAFGEVSAAWLLTLAGGNAPESARH